MTTQVQETVAILEKIRRDQNAVTRDDLKVLLQAQGEAREALFEAAKQLRREQSGNKVYIRGVIDISNYCRCTCSFCGNSALSKELKRYRLPREAMIEAVHYAHELGIDVVHLASGEDPRFPVEDLEAVVQEIVKLGMQVELVLSDIAEPLYEHFYKLGARRYIMKFETSDPELFGQVKTNHRPFHDTIRVMKHIKATGYHLGSGNIVGLPGQTLDTLTSDLFLLRELNVDMASTSAMIPNLESDYRYHQAGDPELALNYLSLLRMVVPNDRLCIPSNSTFGPDGKVLALQLASNELSLNLTPKEFAGHYSIYSGKDRYKAGFDATLGFIEQAGMERATYKEVYSFART